MRRDAGGRGRDIMWIYIYDVRIRVRVDLEQISLSLKTHRPGSQFLAIIPYNIPGGIDIL